jgi:glycerate-2-kinase
MAIWQDLVDHHHFSASYQSVRRFAGKLQAATSEARVIIETPPGEDSQVDYGSGPMVRDQQTGDNASSIDSRYGSQLLAEERRNGGGANAILSDYAPSAGINRHVVRNERVLQERRKRIHLGPESCSEYREVLVEA